MVAWSRISVGAFTAAVSLLLIAKQLGKRVNVVWDLDDTLIKSVHLETFEDESKRNTIIKMSNNVCEHIDDDIMYFRTYLRPYSRLILSSLRFFGVKQYVFTSATVGYMNNICKFLDPNNDIFESKRLSTSDFDKGFLSKTGKNIRLLFNNEKEIEQDCMSCSLLIDDKIKYHKPQPENGILCNVFNGSDDKSLSQLTIYNDTELLRIFWIVFKCFFVKDIRSILIEYQPSKYKSFYE